MRRGLVTTVGEDLRRHGGPVALAVRSLWWRRRSGGAVALVAPSLRRPFPIDRDRAPARAAWHADCCGHSGDGPRLRRAARRHDPDQPAAAERSIRQRRDMLNSQ